MQLAQTHITEPIITNDSFEFDQSLARAIDGFDIQLYTSLVQMEISKLDQLIQTTEPFKVIKVDKEKGIELIKELVKKVFIIAKYIEPIVPDTSKKILEAIATNKKPENLFPRKD
jgi:methionyl-tRNA synthetase